MTYVPLHHPYFQDDHPVILDEMQFKDLMAAVDPRDLPYRNYAPLVKYVKYIGTDANTMKFYVPSPTPHRYPEFAAMNLWETYFQFIEWDQMLHDPSVSASEAARLLFWAGNLRFHCTCPAYKFWGFQYIDTQLGIAIHPEVRFPSIRNPELKGILCKHGIRSLKVLPFHLGDMAKAITAQREEL
jgi:hypothetical protein